VALLEKSCGQDRRRNSGSPSAALVLVVGIPLPSVGVHRAVAAARLDRTLTVLTGSLAAAAALTAVLAAMSGWWMSRRVLLPLRDVSARSN
jgi:hypothetical protein